MSDKTLRCDGDWVDLETTGWNRRGSNDYSNSGTTVAEIHDRTGAVHAPVWDEEPTEVAPGIETRRGCVRVHRSACPVRILWHEYYEYVSYDNHEHNSSWNKPSWLKVVSG